ncbi:SGNH hydrolase-type esterase domain-containing protein [Aspergillus floccosus]
MAYSVDHGRYAHKCTAPMKRHTKDITYLSILIASVQSSTNLSLILIDVLLLLLDLVSGYAIYSPNDSFFSINSNANDGHSTNWVAKWAAIGDSFTVGIGAGNLWSKNADDVVCSRYDQSYVGVLDRAFGNSVKYFQYLACSGARTSDIVGEAKKLESDMDLVVMTARGNDLCLTDVMKPCIMLPYGGRKGCKDAVSKSEASIDRILKPNIREILNELNDEMKHDGVVVYAGSGLHVPKIRPWLQLILENRRKFNELVLKTNCAIENVVEDYRHKNGIRYKIRFADWSPWGGNDKIAGQMCWPGTTGTPLKDDLKKRDDDLLEDAFELAPELVPEAQLEAQPLADRWKHNLYNSILYRTGNPVAEALARLTHRGPIIPPSSLAGHSEVIGGSYSVCKMRDTFQCLTHNRNMGARYMSPSVVDFTYQKYCEEVRVFNEGTHEAHMFTVQLSNGAVKFDKQQCLDSFRHIIYSCDPAQYPNPYGYKHGGKCPPVSYTYQLESVSPHPQTWPRDKPRGKCEGCGLDLTDYHFQWLDKPDKNGMEWKATFNTPIWTRNRCFNNNKVQKRAGGITDGCQGND